MSTQEEWMNEVERELRDLRDAVNTAPTEADIILYTPYQPEDQFKEWIWIRLTAKTTAPNGNKLYAWDEMVHVVNGATDVWVVGNHSGTVTDFPALGLNNEDLAVGNGVRYPARFNAATGQWIFFLRKRGSAPTDWPTGPWVCTMTLADTYSITYPSQPLVTPCGQTTFSSLANNCFGDWPVLEAKLWITWAGIEKLIAWDRHESCTAGLTTVPGYQPFFRNEAYHFPAVDSTNTASWRYEIKLADKVKTFYKFEPPMTLYSRSNPCTQLGVAQLLGPDATVTGTNLTGGGSLTSCSSTNKTTGATVKVTAAPGETYNSGTVSGFRITVMDCQFVGPDPGNLPGDGYDGSGIAEAMQGFVQQFRGITTIIGPTAAFDLCSGKPPTSNKVETVKTFRLGGRGYRLEEMGRSFVGVSPGSVVDDPSACSCNSNTSYMPTMPQLQPFWMGSKITFNHWLATFSDGTPDDLEHFALTGIIDKLQVTDFPLDGCKVPSGWTKTFPYQTSWPGEKYSGSTRLARGNSIISVTLKIEYLG